MEAEEEAGEMTTTEEETDTGDDICQYDHDDILDILGAPPVHIIAGDGLHLPLQDTDTDPDPEATLPVSRQ